MSRTILMLFAVSQLAAQVTLTLPHEVQLEQWPSVPYGKLELQCPASDTSVYWSTTCGALYSKLCSTWDDADKDELKLFSWILEVEPGKGTIYTMRVRVKFPLISTPGSFYVFDLMSEPANADPTVMANEVYKSLEAIQKKIVNEARPMIEKSLPKPPIPITPSRDGRSIIKVANSAPILPLGSVGGFILNKKTAGRAELKFLFKMRWF